MPTNADSDVTTKAVDVGSNWAMVSGVPWLVGVLVTCATITAVDVAAAVSVLVAVASPASIVSINSGSGVSNSTGTVSATPSSESSDS